MEFRSGSSRSERIVALLPPAASAPDVPDWADVVVTASGYEAAAELLAAPAAALLLDLGRVTDAHRPLLTMAGGLEIPVVAFGTVQASMSGEWLTGLHMATRASAGEVLSSVLGETPPEPPGPPAAATDPPSEQGGAPAAGPPAGRQPPRPAEPLTEDELKALLGDDS